MGYQVGLGAVIGAGVMLAGYMLDFPIIISLAASLGTMAFIAFKGGNDLSKRKKDSQLLLPNDEPPPAP
jgi:hypothetical protein